MSSKNRSIIKFVIFEVLKLMPCPSMGPKQCLRWVKFDLDGSKSFWRRPNYKTSPEKPNLNLIKIIWTNTRQIGAIQKDWHPSKTKLFGQAINHFGSIHKAFKT